MQVYSYQTPTELREVEALKLPRLVLNSPILRYFPLEGSRSFYLAWTQRDNYGGMQQIRNLNGRPPRVAPQGEREFLMKPGVYGEHMLLDETEMTLRTAQSDISRQISVNDLVMRRQDQLLVRRLNRIEWLCWQVALYGHFVVHDVRGAISHRDAYPVQRYVAPTPWSDPDASAPLNDFKQIALYGRGKGTNFGRRATAFGNQVTANRLTNNLNPDDFGGKRIGIAGGQTVTSLTDVNNVFMGNDLPQFEVYDETYTDQFGNETPMIPDGKVVVMGSLNNGETIGNFRFVYNAVNRGGEPAPYMRVIDRSENQIPPEIEVHDGFNGGPVIYYPGSIVTMDV